MLNSPLLRSLLALCYVSSCADATADHAAIAPRPAAVRVAVTTVEEAPTPETLTLTGRLRADQRADVTADTQGKVIAVMVERGQHVTKGQPVVRLDVRGAAIMTREASANLAAARAEQGLANQECVRAAMLLDKGAIAKAESDRYATRCASAAQQVSAASARAQMSAKGVNDGMVRAPFDGIVGERFVTPGEWVTPGRSLFTLVDADPLRIELSVPEAGVTGVRLGQEVQLATVAHRGGPYAATITRIGAEIGSSRSLIVEATLAPSKDLVPGMFVEARVVTGHVARPVIPLTAAVQRGTDWHVFVRRDGELEDRIVQLGPAPDAEHVSILQNLAKGDVVVRAVTPQHIDGLRVE